ncbi:MAG: methyl-accepting chemotaxis protein [Treponema sp.]|nr:methyl-accepting chemotaxis protein [Treponema sp.]
MLFSKLKISTKLIISSAVFLIPIGVMLLLICTTTIDKIQKSTDELEGIAAIQPVVTAMQYLPEYLNVYLELQEGNLKELEDTINSAVRSLDRAMRRYRIQQEQPEFSSVWDDLKKIEHDDEDLYHRYLDFFRSLKDAINIIGEYSGLLLVSNMNAYYFVSPALSGIPDAFERLLDIGNPIRRNLSRAQTLIDRYNEELAIRHAEDPPRNVQSRPIEAAPRAITLNNLTTMLNLLSLTAEMQEVNNARPFVESDRERIIFNINAAIEENNESRRRRVRADQFENLTESLERYDETINILLAQYPATRRAGAGRAGGQDGSAVQSPAAFDFLETISRAHSDIYALWEETLSQLDLMVQRNARAARIELIFYLLVVSISLGIAIAFVVFIVKDVNKSVKHLRTLFKGLNENDLTLTLTPNSKDEFGELMVAFNGFLNILRSTFGSFRKSAQLVANSVFDLSSSSKEITTTANEQSASVSEIVSTMESSKNLSEQIALKTTEVANLAIETQSLSSKGAELREANQSMMEDIRVQNQKIISEIRNLSDMIIRISEAIRIIDSIADQTKLIAFNASLEASSSGEAGARFSVVASEIRRFADNVVESTREIKQRIEEVQGASQILITEANNGSKQIEIGYERMSEQKIVFDNIVDNSQNVATRSQQISNLSKQQELASTQIFGALKEISAGVKQFVIATTSTSKTADSLNGMSEDLKEKVDKYRTES